MKTKAILMIIFLVQFFLCFGQGLQEEKSLKESVEEFVKEFKIKQQYILMYQIKFNISFKNIYGETAIF